jgi:DNA-binding transcriptional LysR family regulator
MNLQRLRAFQAIMSTGSVTLAANEMLLTQPAVSKLLKALELEIGFSLFHRSNGRLVPSPQGIAFYQRAQRILTEIDELATIARHVAENRFGELRLVSMFQLSTTIFPAAIREFQAQYPDVFVSLEVIPRRDVDRWIAGLHFDLGVTALPMEWVGLAYDPFTALAPVAVVPISHPLAARQAISAEDLDGQPFIRLTNTNLLRSQIDASLIERNSRPVIKVEVSSPVAACALAAEGVGIAIVDAHSPTAIQRQGYRVLPWKSSPPLMYGFFQPRENSNPLIKPFKAIFKTLAGA